MEINGTVHIGSMVGNLTNIAFTGSMDEILIWNRVLTREEICYISSGHVQHEVNTTLLITLFLLIPLYLYIKIKRETNMEV
jgi:hypothetical protein